MRDITWVRVTTNALLAVFTSFFLSLAFAYFRISLLPNHTFNTNQVLYFLVWLPSLLLIVMYFISRPKGKGTPVLILLIFSLLLLCINLTAIGPSVSFSRGTCYSTLYQGLKTHYQCVCILETNEGDSIDDCEFYGLRFIPFVQERQQVVMQRAAVRLGFDSLEIFPRDAEQINGLPYKIDDPKKLYIFGQDYSDLGYINFQFNENRNEFKILFIADWECSRYYSNVVSVRNTETTSITLCGKEYTLSFANDSDGITVGIQ